VSATPSLMSPIYDLRSLSTFFLCCRAARSGSEEDDDDEGLQDFIVDEEGKPIG
jgi:hypothetical protein